MPRAMTQRKGKSAPDAEDVGHPVGHQQGVGHRDDADQRPDRQVDVARHDDQDHPGRDDRDARGLDRERDHVGRLEELAAAQDVEREQDPAEGDEHAEEPESRSPSGRAGRGSRSARGAGPVPDTGAASARFVTTALLVLGMDTICAPGGPGGAGLTARSAVDDRYLQAAGAVARRRRPCRGLPW